jgi:SAM-dependent methyltransferase
VLDVGCREMGLRSHLPPGADYVGFDLFPPAEVIGTAEEPLPFDDGAFATVVLADVLEHLDDPHGALDEAMRVARNSVVVLLPNLYTLWLRLRYVAGKTAGKYEFGPDQRIDRHRWLMNFDQAADFTRGRAESNGWHVAMECAYDGGFRRHSARFAYRLARLAGGPNLWAWEYAARLEPSSQPAAATTSASIRSNTARSV